MISTYHSPKEDRASPRAMNLDVTIRAVRVLRVQVVLWTSRLLRSDSMRAAVARQTELRDTARDQ